MPSSITRQTFILQGNQLTPTIAYDPVTRVVTITPIAPLTPGQTYSLAIASPTSPTDPNGLRAIDGATLAPSSMNLLEFQVSAAVAAAATPPAIDFCNDVFNPAFHTCGGIGCHGTALPAEGLLLTTPAGVLQTAVGRVAHEANTGANAAPSSPSLLFGQDMPLIDPGTGGSGDPGDSWLMYKLLMALPGASASCDAGAPSAGSPTEDASGEASAGGSSDATVDAPTDGTLASPDGATADAGAPDAQANDSGEAGTTAAGEDGGEDAASAPVARRPVSVCGLYAVAWQPLSSGERATLAGLIPGREMPYPAVPTAMSDGGLSDSGLSVDQLERISLWIAQGAAVPSLDCPSE